MKREIKFRAWDGKKMHFNTIVGNGQVIYIPDAIGEYRWYSQAELIPMQYTGLKDKNGVEIYEGDIVSVMGIDWQAASMWAEDDPRWIEKTPMPETELRRDYVTLNSFRYWLANESFGYEGEGMINPEDCVVIGNIHQNPELL